MKDNKGMSLIELIVVLAISAVLVSITGVSISVLGSSNMKATGRLINQKMAATRLTAMSRSGQYAVQFRKDGGKTYIETLKRASSSTAWTVSSKEEVDKRLTIKYTAGGTTREVDSNRVIFCFKKGSGGLYNCTNISGDDLGKPSKITVVKGDRTYDIQVSAVTGKTSH